MSGDRWVDWTTDQGMSLCSASWESQLRKGSSVFLCWFRLKGVLKSRAHSGGKKLEQSLMKADWWWVFGPDWSVGANCSTDHLWDQKWEFRGYVSGLVTGQQESYHQTYLSHLRKGGSLQEALSWNTLGQGISASRKCRWSSTLSPLCTCSLPLLQSSPWQ